MNILKVEFPLLSFEICCGNVEIHINYQVWLNQDMKKKHISFAQEISWTRSPSVEGLTTAIGSLTPRFLSNDTVKVPKLCVFLPSRCNCFSNVYLISNTTIFDFVYEL